MTVKTKPRSGWAILTRILTDIARVFKPLAGGFGRRETTPSTPARSRVRTEAQKDAAKRKRGENPEATSRASKKWKDNNPDKVKKHEAVKVVKVSTR